MIEPNEFLDACRKGDIETVRQYLNQVDADLECRGYLDMTALLLASFEGHTDVVKALVEQGADINNAWYPERKAGTALEMAGSVAGLMLTTSVLVTELKDEDKDEEPIAGSVR